MREPAPLHSMHVALAAEEEDEETIGAADQAPGDSAQLEGLDEGGQMTHALQQVAHSVQQGPKLSQRQRREAFKSSILNQKLTPEQVATIAAAVDKGELKLPDMSHLDQKDFVNVWSLSDSGSAECVASQEKHSSGQR